MTDRPNRKLKAHLNTACTVLGLSFTEFARESDLIVFFLDTDQIESIRTIAAKALSELTSRVSGHMRDVPVVAAINYLDAEAGRPIEDPTQERRLKDLKQLVADGGNESAYRRLIDSWYD